MGTEVRTDQLSVPLTHPSLTETHGSPTLGLGAMRGSLGLIHAQLWSGLGW